MFILRMIFRSFSRQFRRRLLVAITICLSSAVATAMLGVVFDVGDKLNEELSAYGSNIVIEPKSDAVVADLYETVDGSDTEPTSFLKESDIQKIKTIFWAYNITNFAPKLNLHADITAGTGGDAATVPVVGTWFNTTLHLATGETSVVGVQGHALVVDHQRTLGAGTTPTRAMIGAGPRRPTAHRRPGHDHQPYPEGIRRPPSPSSASTIRATRKTAPSMFPRRRCRN